MIMLFEAKLMAVGQGLVSVPHSWSTSHNLPSTMKDRNDDSYDVYFVAAFHQLHCLVSYDSLQTPLAFVKNSNSLFLIQSVVRAAIYRFHEGVKQTVEWPHMIHCIDSLRQSLMCAANDELLYANSTRVYGDRQMRVCHDWDALYSWTEDHRYE